ncbi:MAG: hypothetical protein IJW25_01915 [Clostridia bacterium]|nr:hypothetical protein [Clostridia bacterium]
MNIFEKRIEEFNNQNNPAQGGRIRLRHGTKFNKADSEIAKYNAYMQFALDNIDKVGTVEEKRDYGSYEKGGAAKRMSIVYTEYGPIIKYMSENFRGGRVYSTMEGIFKFNVDGQDKLLYARVRSKGIHEVYSSVRIRREDGSFEKCDWNNKESYDLKELYQDGGPQQLHGAQMYRYFNEQKSAIESAAERS